MKKFIILFVFAASMAAKADYWMTFCRTPSGRHFNRNGGYEGRSYGDRSERGGAFGIFRRFFGR